MWWNVLLHSFCPWSNKQLTLLFVPFGVWSFWTWTNYTKSKIQLPLIISNRHCREIFFVDFIPGGKARVLFILTGKTLDYYCTRNNDVLLKSVVNCSNNYLTPLKTFPPWKRADVEHECHWHFFHIDDYYNSLFYNSTTESLLVFIYSVSFFSSNLLKKTFKLMTFQADWRPGSIVTFRKKRAVSIHEAKNRLQSPRNGIEAFSGCGKYSKHRTRWVQWHNKFWTCLHFKNKMGCWVINEK